MACWSISLCLGRVGCRDLERGFIEMPRETVPVPVKASREMRDGVAESVVEEGVDDGRPAKRLRPSDFFISGASLELATPWGMTKGSLDVDRRSVELAYYHELSKQLYALTKEAVESLDRVAKIDTIITQLNHELLQIKQDQEQCRKALGELESMMKNGLGELWNQVEIEVAGEAAGTPSGAE